MDLKNFKHCTPLQIRFSDIDKLNHVNNAYYLTYIETARVRYFRDVFKSEIDWSKNGFVIARSEINYLKPIYLEDEIFCFTSVARFGNKSLSIESLIVKKIKGEPVPCASGLNTIVAMDYIKKESITVPSLWIRLISAFEEKEFKRPD